MNPNVILCPIELAASGRSALLQAAELTRWYGAELHVAHVRGGRARRQPSNEPSSTGLSSFVDAIDSDGLRLRSIVLTGDPVRAVTEHAKLIAAELVVVPGHGRRFGAYWRPGVFAKDLARALACPTLAVPDAGPRDARESFGVCPVLMVRASSADVSRVPSGEVMATASNHETRPISEESPAAQAMTM